jgi:histidyl-tRNA synthetase
MGVTCALILGKEEIASRNVTFRDMTGGEQKTIPMSEIVPVLLSKIRATTEP